MLLRILLVLTLALAALVGCASREDQGFKVLSTSAPVGAVTADEIYPAIGGVRTYLITAGDGRGEHIVHRRQATERYGADWADRQGDRRVEFWRRDEAGNIVMPVVVDHADRAITLFEPPLIIAYRQLSPGATRRQEVAMRPRAPSPCTGPHSSHRSASTNGSSWRGKRRASRRRVRG